MWGAFDVMWFTSENATPNYTSSNEMPSHREMLCDF